jgi:type IV pilus assembly protein PilV
MNSNSSFRREGGFSLLEVLIAVVVAMIGLIGIASLHLTSAAYNESSLNRTNASGLAREMIERMRANAGEAKDGFYDITSLPTTLTQDCESTAANCTADEMRDHDLRLWSARVAALLPGGGASIATDTSVSPPDITIVLSWNKRAHEGSLDTQATPVSQTFVFKL